VFKQQDAAIQEENKPPHLGEVNGAEGGKNNENLLPAAVERNSYE
jgi:hypothetical protein